jgi:putative transposase
MIEYKCKLVGINVLITEESYTSKCSFLDSEDIKKQKEYKGKRIKRGLFKSSEGVLINADVNGSLNILRKVVGNFNYDPIEVCSTPAVITVKFN